jgi:serine protease inhibitor
MFDDKGATRLDFNISRLVTKIKGVIKKSEEKLKSMQSGDALLTANSNGIKQKSKVKQTVIQNVQQKYLAQLQEFTRQLKSVQKDYEEKVKEFGDDL